MTTEDGPNEGVRRILDTDRDEYTSRAVAEAEVLKDALRDGTFDNHQSMVGFEYEFYAVGDGRWSGESRAGEYALMRVPRRLLDLVGFEKELGLHNAEMSTSPQPLSNHGLRAQLSEVRARLAAANDCTGVEGMRLVSDGIWTVPPAGETATGYLTDSVDVDGVTVATNMSDVARYHAMANTETTGSAEIRLEAPGVSLPADTVMPESLITSIQPHYQTARASTLPERFRYALRVAGPLLALGVNSPFFPPDLYDADWSGEQILEHGAHGNRIHVFESVLNGRTEEDKVRFPDDIDDLEEAVDRIAGDETIVPAPDIGEDGRYDDAFSAFRSKHGTYWRWVRPVFEGPTRSSAHARIEFRPIAGQPTVRDSIAFQAAFAGLMEALPRHEHAASEQPWATARDNFYAAVADGLDAELRWVTADGDSTRDIDRIYADLLDHAAAGLVASGCTESDAELWLEPLRWRVENRVTPASWKRERVRERLADGASFEEAVHGMQREYIESQTGTLIGGGFSDW